MVKAIVLMRHAEREDRAAEMKGIDWISTAARPQDPLLSEEGIEISVCLAIACRLFTSLSQASNRRRMLVIK